jgi:hypothetical protein
LEALRQYLIDQRFLAEPVALEDIFAPIFTWSE